MTCGESLVIGADESISCSLLTEQRIIRPPTADRRDAAERPLPGR